MSFDNVWFGINGSLLCLVLLSQIGLWAVLFQVVKQQGRILLRLDDIGPTAALARHDHAAELPVLNPAAAAAAASGPKIGDRVAPFRLPDLAGHDVSLDDFLGKQVLLVHWSPKCGFCDLIAPELAEQQTLLLDRGVQLVLISHGDPVANVQLAQEHGLHCPILIQPDDQSLDVFRHQGTPVACLVDKQGRVAQQLAVGATVVPQLVRELVTTEAPERRSFGQRPLSESRIVREGLKAGTQAPGFSLSDIYGSLITLETYRGRRVALIFTDPHCGPCEALAPVLARLSNACRSNDLALVMVSRGDIAESRAKAEQHGFDFPVVVQQRWEVSKAFGIFATPVAFLIDETGLIARDVAQGADAIVALIESQLEARKELAHGIAIR